MAEHSIQLGRLGSERGIYAAILNVEKACSDAARKLRFFADAFDTLSESDDPFKDKTHRAAMTAARRSRRKT
jgi:hypothetical protein